MRPADLCVTLQMFGLEVGGSKLCRDKGPKSCALGERLRKILQHADLHLVLRDFRHRGQGRYGDQHGGNGQQTTHHGHGPQEIVASSSCRNIRRMMISVASALIMPVGTQI